MSRSCAFRVETDDGRTYVVECLRCRTVLNPAAWPAAVMGIIDEHAAQACARWTGPTPNDYNPGNREMLAAPVPAERWPYGPPARHQDACRLHAGGLFCDCAASDASDQRWGVRFL